MGLGEKEQERGDERSHLGCCSKRERKKNIDRGKMSEFSMNNFSLNHL